MTNPFPKVKWHDLPDGEEQDRLRFEAESFPEMLRLLRQNKPARETIAAVLLEARMAPSELQERQLCDVKIENRLYLSLAEMLADIRSKFPGVPDDLIVVSGNNYEVSYVRFTDVSEVAETEAVKQLLKFVSDEAPDNLLGAKQEALRNYLDCRERQRRDYQQFLRDDKRKKRSSQ